MNTDPENELRNLWLEDDLSGDELLSVGKQFGEDLRHLADREHCRRWKNWIGNHLPREQEPAAPELFNARILREIAGGQAPVTDASPVRRATMIRWFVPMAAAAGMAIGFFVGAGKDQVPEMVDIDVTGAPKAIPVELTLYTPEQGVKADWFKSAEADAYVIVLEGVPAIPDEVDFSQRMSSNEPEAESSMVELEEQAPLSQGGGS